MAADTSSEAARPGRARRAGDAAVACVFFAALALPGLTAGWGLADAVSVEEKRRLSEPPEIPRTLRALKRFPGAFDRYFNDHFGLRSWLLEARGVLETAVFGVSSSREVLAGREGWLFHGSPSVGALSGAVRLSQDDLTRMQRDLERKHDWLAARGIRYLFVITPAKQSIYPEFLPRWHRRVGSSTTDQLLNHLVASGSDVPILDLRPALLAARTHGQLYARTDSHWGSLGGFHAYRALVARLTTWFPALTPRSVESLRVTAAPPRAGNLAKKLGLAAHLQESGLSRVELRDAPCARTRLLDLSAPKPWARHERPFETTCEGAPEVRLLMMRDSFATRLVPFLSEHFRGARFVWQNSRNHDREDTLPLLQALVEAERPDVVVDQVPERKLTLLR